MENCKHNEVSCLNPYELIRKYRCESCGEVMMCACDEELGLRFLPHQIDYGTDLGSKCRIPVTLGFQKGICNRCKGLPEEAHPKGEIYGCSTKIRRYYWREIHIETIKRFGDWAISKGYKDKDWLRASSKHKDIYDAIKKEVLDEIKELHSGSPKYEFHEESQDEILTKNKVEIIRLDGVYTKHDGRGVRILDGGDFYSAEEFVACHFRQLGYNVLFTESRPFHAIFGIFMYLLIQDLEDPKVRMIGFPDRRAEHEGKLIWTFLPEDFGSHGYAIQRSSAIREHLDFLPHNKDALLWTFDYWIEYSSDLRQYLWAHDPEDVEKAKVIVSILPVDIIFKILEYLIEDYWGRYCGWPDLLVYDEKNFFFVEVKSSGDKLSEDQKKWIKNNASTLNLPFKLVKIHKKHS